MIFKRLSIHILSRGIHTSGIGPGGPGLPGIPGAPVIPGLPARPGGPCSPGGPNSPLKYHQTITIRNCGEMLLYIGTYYESFYQVLLLVQKKIFHYFPSLLKIDLVEQKCFCCLK